VPPVVGGRAAGVAVDESFRNGAPGAEQPEFDVGGDIEDVPEGRSAFLAGPSAFPALQFAHPSCVHVEDRPVLVVRIEAVEHSVDGVRELGARHLLAGSIRRPQSFTPPSEHGVGGDDRVGMARQEFLPSRRRRPR
jgi:hypothetical protein